MLTNDIIDAAFDSLFGNLKSALRISIVPLAIALLIVLLANYPTIVELIEQGGGVVSVPESRVLVFLTSLLIFVYTTFFVAVKWHRFSLNMSASNSLIRPLFYALTYLLILLVVLIGLLPVLVIASAALGTGMSIQIGDFHEAMARGPIHVAINALFTLVFAYVFLHCSPTIVSVAVGEPHGDPFNKIPGLRRKALHIAVLFTLATLAWSLLGFLDIPTLLNLAVSLVISWIAFMFSIAILTEFYRLGVTAEGAEPDETQASD